MGVEDRGLVTTNNQTGVLNPFWMSDAFKVLMEVVEHLSRNNHDTSCVPLCQFHTQLLS